MARPKRPAHSEALGVALLALGALLLLAVGLPRIAADGRNLIGPVGVLLDGWLVVAVGGFGFLVVVPALIWGLYSFGLMSRSVALRASIFGITLMVFVPTLGWLLSSSAGGWVGRAAGHLLVSGFGTLGAFLIVAAVLLAVTVLALELSVVRAAGRLATLTWRGIRRSGVWVWGALYWVVQRLAGAAASLRSSPAEPESPWESTAD